MTTSIQPNLTKIKVGVDTIMTFHHHYYPTTENDFFVVVV